MLRVKIVGSKRILTVKESGMHAPTKIWLRHGKEDEELIDESESLEDIIKTLKRLDVDLREDSFRLYFDEYPHSRLGAISLELHKALEPESIDEGIMIFGKITDGEKKEIKPLFVKTQEVLA